MKSQLGVIPTRLTVQVEVCNADGEVLGAGEKLCANLFQAIVNPPQSLSRPSRLMSQTSTSPLTSRTTSGTLRQVVLPLLQSA